MSESELESEPCSYPDCFKSKYCLWYVENKEAYHPNCVFYEVECCSRYIQKEAI